MKKLTTLGAFAFFTLAWATPENRDGFLVVGLIWLSAYFVSKEFE